MSLSRITRSSPFGGTGKYSPTQKCILPFSAIVSFPVHILQQLTSSSQALLHRPIQLPHVQPSHLHDLGKTRPMRTQRNSPLRSRTRADLCRVPRTLPKWNGRRYEPPQPQRHGQLSSMPVYNRSGLSSDAEPGGEVLWMEERWPSRRVRVRDLWACFPINEVEDETDEKSGGLEE